MTVGDFQKYLRALADAIGPGKPANELTTAANALTPFAGYAMEKFAERLVAVEAKYKETGHLPDPTPKKEPAPRKAKQPAAPKLTADNLSAMVADLKSRLDNREVLDRAAIAADLKPFEKLPKTDLARVMTELKFPKEITPRDKAIAAIVNHILSPHTADSRADV